MGVSVHGWVEVCRVPEARNETYGWSGLIRLDALIDVCDVVSEVVFGFSKRVFTDGLPFEPLACGRGIPVNPSYMVTRELEAIREHERQHGVGEYFGYTHVLYDEVLRVEWAKYGITRLSDSCWWRVFRMLDTLYGSDEAFAPERTRITAWVSW